MAVRRTPRTGCAKIRVYNPVPDSWSSPHTIVEIVNDDMPFLVDSVIGAINATNRVVHLATYPTVTVARTPDGHLQEVHDSDAPGLRESWVQIEITAESDPADLASLTQKLSSVLADVRGAVEDWQPMRRVCAMVVGEFGDRPPPLPPTEVRETHDFLAWLDDDNFTFLGYREYAFGGAVKQDHEPLGILRAEAHPVFGGLRDLSPLPSDVQAFARRRELLVITKSNSRATVHRTAHMDAIGVRRLGPDGDVVGIRVFLGLFTSLAYSRNPRSIPLLRLKVRHILERAGLSPTSHDGKALLHILDTFPRDELFQTGADELFGIVTGILNLQERQRTAVFIRRDRWSALCPVSSTFRGSAKTAICAAVSPRLSRLPSPARSQPSTPISTISALARIHFIIRTGRGAVPAVDVARLEQQLAEAGRSWMDRLQQAAIAAFSDEDARIRLRRFRSFPIAYQACTDADQAVADLRRIEAVFAGSPIEVSFHSPTTRRFRGLRIYRADEPVVLSDVMPVLENPGLRVGAEEPFRFDTVNEGSVWVQDFTLAGGPVGTGATEAAIAKRLAEAAKRWQDRGQDIHYSYFISYSSKDEIFAEQLHADFQSQGVRCWFAPHDLPTVNAPSAAADRACRIAGRAMRGQPYTRTLGPLGGIEQPFAEPQRSNQRRPAEPSDPCGA
jgi:glutamate dehydrogenase